MDVVRCVGKCHTSVNRAERKAQQTVVVAVLHKLLADLLGGFDSLASRSDAADGNSVLVDITAGATAIAVGDLPAISVQLGGVTSGLVDAVAGLLGGGKLRGEHPTRYGQFRTPSTKIILGHTGPQSRCQSPS